MGVHGMLTINHSRFCTWARKAFHLRGQIRRRHVRNLLLDVSHLRKKSVDACGDR